MRKRRNPGNVFLSDEPEYTPKPQKTPVYGESGIDAGRGESDPMSVDDWVALGAKVAVGAMVAKALLDKAPTHSDGEAVLKQLDDSANKADVIPVDPLPLAPSINQIAEQILADQRVQSVLRLAQGYPNQAFKIPQLQNFLPQVHQQSPMEKKQIEVSYIGPPGGNSGYSPGDITGTGKSSPSLTSNGPTRKIDRVKFGGLGDVTQDALATGAAAVQAMNAASGESTAYLEQAAMHPDQIVENTKKMSVLGVALTLYTLSWAYKMLGR